MMKVKTLRCSVDAEDYALALEKDQPGSQAQMSRLASGSLWGSRRGSRQNSGALPESAWRVPALHGLGESTLMANDMHGVAVEVLSDSSASPSPRASLQPGACPRCLRTDVRPHTPPVQHPMLTCGHNETYTRQLRLTKQAG